MGIALATMIVILSTMLFTVIVNVGYDALKTTQNILEKLLLVAGILSVIGLLVLLTLVLANAALSL